MFELWFRKIYQPLLEDRSLTAALRPDNRIFPSSKGMKMGEVVKIKIIALPGDDERKIQATLLDSFEILVRIEELVVKRIKELNPKDFVGMSPDCQSKESAKFHLGLIYDRIFTDEDKVTVIKWSYEKFQ